MICPENIMHAAVTRWINKISQSVKTKQFLWSKCYEGCGFDLKISNISCNFFSKLSASFTRNNIYSASTIYVLFLQINSPSNWDPQVLLGLKVGTTNSDQTWTDGSDVDYTAWFSGEPNNLPDSRAAIAAGSHSQGNWADVFASSSLKYLCMLPCIEYHLE